MGRYSDNYLNHLLECFIPGKTFRISPIDIGFINDTYLVESPTGPEYVLQRINPAVFSNAEALMANISLALQKLDNRDYQKITLVQSCDNKPYFKDGKGYWRLMTYIPDSITYSTTDKEQIAFEAGRIIGRFHHLLANAPLKEYVDTIPDFHNLPKRIHQLEDAISTTSANKLKSAQKALGFIESTYPLLEPLTREVLPRRICHNDTKLNNILFSKSTQTALCLIDLDTIMKGYFYYDFGDAARTIVNTAQEDEKNHEKITFEPHLFKALVAGIATNDPFLSQEEIKTLPLGTVFMPFIHGVRALTDYLNHNKYYKVSYENQNLDRCLSLFDFTEKALDHLHFMQECIHDKLA